MKKIIFIVVVTYSSANAGFFKHVAMIGSGIAVGHAADKVIDYEVEKFKNTHKDNNASKR